MLRAERHESGLVQLPYRRRNEFAMMIRTWCLLVAGVVYLLAGCASVPDVPGALPVGREGVLTGTVNYRERIVLPPDALVEVWMIDVSPGMLVLPLIAETAIATQNTAALQ